MQNYKDLNVWRKAHDLVLYLYKLTVAFPKVEQFTLITQIRRAGVSIPSNIAEGCGKYTQSDLANYLQIALGSTNEVEYLAYLSHDLGYITDDSFAKLESDSNEIRGMLISLIKKVRKK